MATETLEIVFVDEGMATASSFLFALAGGTSIEKCKFVARVFAPNGTYDLLSVSFQQAYYGRDSVGAQTKDAQKALDQLRREIESRGWQPTESGPRWYSYRYQCSQKSTKRELSDGRVIPATHSRKTWVSRVGALQAVFVLLGTTCFSWLLSSLRPGDPTLNTFFVPGMFLYIFTWPDFRFTGVNSFQFNPVQGFVLLGLFETIPLFLGSICGRKIGLTGGIGFFIGGYVGTSFYLGSSVANDMLSRVLIHPTDIDFVPAVLCIATLGIIAGYAFHITRGLYNSLRAIAIAEGLGIVGLLLTNIYISQVFNRWYSEPLPSNPLLLSIPALLMFPILLVAFNVIIKYKRQM